MFVQRAKQLPVAYGGTFAPRQDHEVYRRPSTGEAVAETLPDDTLDAVSHNRSFVYLA